MQSHGLSPADVGMSPWQVSAIQKQLRKMNSALLVGTLEQLAKADIASKGGDIDKGQRALEKTLLMLAGNRL
jgi:DNA polymerase III delta subunit